MSRRPKPARLRRESLQRCPWCRTTFVCPMRWQAAGAKHWVVHLRCGECGARRAVKVTDTEAADFEVTLDRQSASIALALMRIERERMERLIATFATALARDLIDAADFA